MGDGATIHARVDAQTKAQAQGILNQLGMTLSEAISLYLRQIIFNKGIPFEVKIPNALTAETLEQVDRGENLHEAGSVNEMFKELDMSPEELSEYLGVAKGTLYSWTYSKQIPHYKIGRRVKFKPEEIDKWLEKKRQKVYEYKPLNL